jgi:hypothetical protein
MILVNASGGEDGALNDVTFGNLRSPLSGRSSRGVNLRLSSQGPSGRVTFLIDAHHKDPGRAMRLARVTPAGKVLARRVCRSLASNASAISSAACFAR